MDDCARTKAVLQSRLSANENYELACHAPRSRSASTRHPPGSAGGGGGGGAFASINMTVLGGRFQSNQCYSISGCSGGALDAANHNYHLAPGSKAIDAGINAGINFDIDGDPRPIAAGFDIGFDEALFKLLLPLIKR
jgi:hypothetical protein